MERPFGVDTVVAGILAIICFGGTVVIAVTNRDVPDILRSADALILGFYFGYGAAKTITPPPKLDSGK